VNILFVLFKEKFLCRIVNAKERFGFKYLHERVCSFSREHLHTRNEHFHYVNLIRRARIDFPIINFLHTSKTTEIVSSFFKTYITNHRIFLRRIFFLALYSMSSFFIKLLIRLCNDFRELWT